MIEHNVQFYLMIRDNISVMCQECGLGCYSILGVCLVSLSLALTLLTIFVVRRLRGSRRKLQVSHSALI